MNNFFDTSKALQIILNKAYDKGISQSKLIEGIYDYSHFNRMCNGKESIKIDILVLCCLKLDISFDQVIQSSKEKHLLDLDGFYNQFETIRLKRNYDELMSLYHQITSDDYLYNLNKYKQLSSHILAIIEVKTKHNYAGAIHLLEQAFEFSGHSIKQYQKCNLSKEQIEILIDYSLCCISLHNPLWKEILFFLEKEKNNYTDKEIFCYMYPKIAYNISTMFLIDKDYSNSLFYSEKVIEFCKKENNFIYLPYLYYNSACSLLMLKNYSKAKEYLENSKSIFKLQNHLDEFQKTYQADYQTYFNHSDFAI